MTICFVQNDKCPLENDAVPPGDGVVFYKVRFLKCKSIIIFMQNKEKYNDFSDTFAVENESYTC